MSKKLLLIVGIIIAIVIFALLIFNRIHIALGSILLLIDLVVVYSYTSIKDKAAPEDPHDTFAVDFEEEKEVDELFEKKTKICLVCQTENNINRKYCKKCNNLIQNIICPVCDTENPHTQKYCIKCDSILQNKRRS